MLCVCSQGPDNIRGWGSTRPPPVRRIKMDVQLQTCQEPDVQGAATHHRLPGTSIVTIPTANLLCGGVAWGRANQIKLWILVFSLSLTSWVLDIFQPFLLIGNISWITMEVYIYECVCVEFWADPNKTMILWICMWFHSGTEEGHYGVTTPNKSFNNKRSVTFGSIKTFLLAMCLLPMFFGWNKTHCLRIHVSRNEMMWSLNWRTVSGCVSDRLLPVAVSTGDLHWDQNQRLAVWASQR